MPKRKTTPDKKWLSVLGGSALFGYLGCVPQESGPASIVAPHTAGADSSARKDTVASVVLRPDSAAPVVSKPDTIPSDPAVAIRRGPTLKEKCVGPDDYFPIACTFEGLPLTCHGGEYIQGPGLEVSYRYCVAADTVIHSLHMGFNGLDKVAETKLPDLLVRRRMAESLETRSA